MVGCGAGAGREDGSSNALMESAIRLVFVSALSTGFVVGALVALGASVVAWMLIDQRVAAPEPEADVPVAT